MAANASFDETTERDTFMTETKQDDVTAEPSLAGESLIHQDAETGKSLGLAKQTLAVENTRNIGKSHLKLNTATPEVEVNPETYEVRADGELLTCQPAEVLPLAQRYFLF